MLSGRQVAQTGVFIGQLVGVGGAHVAAAHVHAVGLALIGAAAGFIAFAVAAVIGFDETGAIEDGEIVFDGKDFNLNEVDLEGDIQINQKRKRRARLSAAQANLNQARGITP